MVPFCAGVDGQNWSLMTVNSGDSGACGDCSPIGGDARAGGDNKACGDGRVGRVCSGGAPSSCCCAGVGKVRSGATK